MLLVYHQPPCKMGPWCACFRWSYCRPRENIAWILPPACRGLEVLFDFDVLCDCIRQINSPCPTCIRSGRRMMGSFFSPLDFSIAPVFPRKLWSCLTAREYCSLCPAASCWARSTHWKCLTGRTAAHGKIRPQMPPEAQPSLGPEGRLLPHQTIPGLTATCFPSAATSPEYERVTSRGRLPCLHRAGGTTDCSERNSWRSWRPWWQLPEFAWSSREGFSKQAPLCGSESVFVNLTQKTHLWKPSSIINAVLNFWKFPAWP